MNEFAELLAAGEADLMNMLGEPAVLRELPGTVERAVTVVLSPMTETHAPALGGAVLDVRRDRKTGLHTVQPIIRIRKETNENIKTGWRIVTRDGKEYEIERIESSTHDPTLHLTVKRRK